MSTRTRRATPQRRKTKRIHNVNPLALAASVITLPIPAIIDFFDMEASITPPDGYLEPQPLTMGPNQQPNDLRIQLVTGSESAPGNVTEAVAMVPDPPTGFVAGYNLDAGFETEGVNWRYLLTDDPDVSVAWIKPTGWRHWCWALLTARGTDPATAPQSGALWPTIQHSVGNNFFTCGPITVPGPGVMVFALGAVEDPEGNWPSWASSIGLPAIGDWQNLTATDKSGVTYYAFDTSHSFAVFGNKYLSAGTTGTITFPCDPGSHAFTGMWVFLAAAPGYASTGSPMTATASMATGTSSVSSNPVSQGSPMVATASMSTGFNPLLGYAIQDPIQLTGDPVSVSIVKWATGPAVPVINSVGPLYEAHGTALATLGITTVSPGDVIMLTTAVGSNTITATGVTGGNVPSSGPGSWQRVVAPVNDSGVVVNVDMWMGTVNAVGPATITVAYSASIAGLPCYYDAQQFTANAGAATVWAVDGAQSSGADRASSLTLLYPALTPGAPNELYYGLAWSGQPSTVAGATPGFSWARDSIGRLATWTTKASTVAPTATQTVAGSYISSAVLLKASVPAAPGATALVKTSINNGLSWDVATNGEPIPRLRNGDITTRTVLSRVEFSRVNATDAIPCITSLRVDPYVRQQTDELIPTFYGPVDKVTTKITAGSSGGTGSGSSGQGVTTTGGGMFGGGAVMKIHATDPSRTIDLAQWPNPFVGPTNVTYDQLLKAMVLNRRPQQTLFNQVSTNLVVPSSLLVWGLNQGASHPWQDMRGVAAGFGSECLYDVIGAFTSHPVPDPRRGPVSWNLDHTSRPCMIGVESELDTSLICNGYIIIGQSTNSANPVNAFAYDLDTASKYNAYPPPIGIGQRFQRIVFSTLVTTAQCQAVANALLFNSLGLANTCTIGIVPHPGIALGDIVRINSPETGVVGRFYVQGYTMPDGHTQQVLTCFRQTDNPN